MSSDVMRFEHLDILRRYAGKRVKYLMVFLPHVWYLPVQAKGLSYKLLINCLFMEEYTLNALYAWNITVFTLDVLNWLLLDVKLCICYLRLGTNKTMLR